MDIGIVLRKDDWKRLRQVARGKAKETRVQGDAPRPNEQ